VRLTVAKSDTKQVYHDARKSSWGDLFPHRPRATERVRTRGIKKLNKITPADEDYTPEVDGFSEEIDVNQAFGSMGEGAAEVDEAVVTAESKVLEELLREMPAAQWENIGG
jgi:hypothetical protein